MSHVLHEKDEKEEESKLKWTQRKVRGIRTLLASFFILNERFLKRQTAAYRTRHSECLSNLTITGIPPRSLFKHKFQQND